MSIKAGKKKLKCYIVCKFSNSAVRLSDEVKEKSMRKTLFYDFMRNEITFTHSIAHIILHYASSCLKSHSCSCNVVADKLKRMFIVERRDNLHAFNATFH